MKDTIVQEVREVRAAVAADFGCDLGNFFAQAKARTTAERKAKRLLPTQPATPAKSTRRKTAKAPVK